MYHGTEACYDAVYSFKDYAKEAAKLLSLIRAHLPEAKTLLDVACGTGRHLEHLKRAFSVAGVDINARFAEIARRRNPDVPFHVGDMINLHLGSRFDVVTCLFSSIGYVRTVLNLGRAVQSMTRHATPDGMLVIEPWFTPGLWHPNSVHARFIDEPELKIARVSTSKQSGKLSIIDMHYLVGTPKATEHFRERHEMGLFTASEMIDAMERCGLRVIHEKEGLTGRGLYLGFRSMKRGP